MDEEKYQETIHINVDKGTIFHVTPTDSYLRSYKDFEQEQRTLLEYQRMLLRMHNIRVRIQVVVRIGHKDIGDTYALNMEPDGTLEYKGYRGEYASLVLERYFQEVGAPALPLEELYTTTVYKLIGLDVVSVYEDMYGKSRGKLTAKETESLVKYAEDNLELEDWYRTVEMLIEYWLEDTFEDDCYTLKKKDGGK